MKNRNTTYTEYKIIVGLKILDELTVDASCIGATDVQAVHSLDEGASLGLDDTAKMTASCSNLFNES